MIVVKRGGRALVFPRLGRQALICAWHGRRQLACARCGGRWCLHGMVGWGWYPMAWLVSARRGEDRLRPYSLVGGRWRAHAVVGQHWHSLASAWHGGWALASHGLMGVVEERWRPRHGQALVSAQHGGRALVSHSLMGRVSGHYYMTNLWLYVYVWLLYTCMAYKCIVGSSPNKDRPWGLSHVWLSCTIWTFHQVSCTNWFS